MRFDPYQTNSQIFNRLCSSPLSSTLQCLGGIAPHHYLVGISFYHFLPLFASPHLLFNVPYFLFAVLPILVVSCFISPCFLSLTHSIPSVCFRFLLSFTLIFRFLLHFFLYFRIPVVLSSIYICCSLVFLIYYLLFFVHFLFPLTSSVFPFIFLMFVYRSSFPIYC